MIVTSRGGKVRLFDTRTMRQIGTLFEAVVRPFVYAVSAPDGEHVVASDSTGRTWIWPSSVAGWTAHACSVANRNLTRTEWDEFIPGAAYRAVCP